MESGEKYQVVIHGESPSIRLGHFSNLVFEKHRLSFGDDGASKVKNAVVSVFSDLMSQLLSSKSNNTLLVGKVQSGKTSNLEFLTALAFDNEFNLLIIFGGYDTELLSQTTERFRQTFEIGHDHDLNNRKTPVLFTSDSHDTFSVNSLNSQALRRIVDADIPIIMSVLKNGNRLRAVNDLLSQIDQSRLKALIIDDEGDQASLNNAKDKASEASATYDAIRQMKQLLDDPLYCSVTATPQANIFLDELSALRPDSIHLLYPGTGYCGADIYHLQDGQFHQPVEEGIDSYLEVNNGNMPGSLQVAVKHFLLASIMMRRRGINDSDMIVHMDKTVDSHSVIYTWIDNYVLYLREAVEEAFQKGNPAAIEREFGPASKSFFTNGAQDELHLGENKTLSEMNDVLDGTYCILQNGTDTTTRNSAGFFNHRIYVGADLLQRGLTFRHLVTTYFTRWAKSGGNMDTNLQRARWFGYREEYLDLCRMFTTEEIANEFVNLAYIEDDLWRQFVAIEDGELAISDIVVLAENTRQNPTRKSVVNFTKFTVSEWLRQNYGIFDTNQINFNNNMIEYFIGDLNFEETSIARRDGKANCRIAVADRDMVYHLFFELEGIFGRGFEQSDVLSEIGSASSVAIIQMSRGTIRKRAFYDQDHNRIKVLQQGRGSKESSESQYLGDAAVYAREYGLTIQIHRVMPTHADTNTGKQVPEPNNVQYMFAVYSPGRATSGFVRG